MKTPAGWPLARWGVWFLFPLAAATSGAEPLQVLRNGGFEEDEMSYRGEPTSSCGGALNDQWFNMQDRFPDVWAWPGKCAPNPYGMAAQHEWPLEDVALDSAARSGKFALRLQGKAVSIQQSLEWNKLVDIYADVAGSNWGLKDHTGQFPVRDGLFQDLLLEGWVKCGNVPQDATGSASVLLAGAGTAKFDIPKGNADWTKFQAVLSAAEQAKAAKPGNPGTTLTVTLSYTSPSGAGQVWFDDLSLSLAERSEPNLLPNPSFERAADGSKAPPGAGRGANVAGAAMPSADTPYPDGWSAPMKWVHLPPPAYYVWNNWQHFYTPCRGHPRLDGLVARTGNRCLRLDLLGGDEYALESPAIGLNQAEARPVEVTAWVKADRLRHLDFMLIDQDGRRVPANPTLLFWGGPLSGTHEWVAVRKVFLGFEPLKSFRLRIGGRGFNGTTKTDIGYWHAYNQVSTAWIDDLAVRELYSTGAELAQRGVTVPASETPARGIRLSALDLGERLYGENEITATVRNSTDSAARVALEATLVTPGGKKQKPERGRSAKAPPAQTAAVTAAYALNELSPSWRQPGQLLLSLVVNGKPAASETYSYGTWPAVADVRPSKACLDETETPLLVAINLGLARRTLAGVKALDLEVVDRRTGKAALSAKVSDVAAAIASARITPADKDRFYFYMPRAGLLDHRNLILTELDITKLPARPPDEPESDWLVRVSAGKTFSAESHPFARLIRTQETLPPVKEVAVDPVGHFLRVNGQPFFVFAHSHANGAALGGAPKSRSVAFGDDRTKGCGMNSVGRWRGVEDADGGWQANLYAPMLMASPVGEANLKEKLQELEAGKITMWKTAHGTPLPYTVAQVNSHPAALGVFAAMSEALISDSPDLRAQEQFADAVRKKVNRPVGIMDNHSQFYPWNDESGLLDHVDLLFMEREEGNLFRPELSIREWMRRKQTWMVCDLPQTYENVPHERARYQAIRNTLHGARGWFGIQGCADPSLYRLLGGELRRIFAYLSANEGCPEVTAPEGVFAKAWRKGSRVLVIAEQHNPVPRGKWEWKTGVGGRESPAHSGASRHIVTPVKDGYAVHGYNDDLYREVAAGDSVRQEVYLQPDRAPQAVFLVVPGNNDFSHVATWGNFDWNDFHGKGVDAFLAGECYSMAAYGINWSRTPDPVFLEYQRRRRFPASCFIRMGDLPKPGEWATLTVPLDKLNLTGKVVDGLLFMTSGSGVAWWGKSTLVRKKDGKEETLLDGRIGRDPELYRQATFRVAGLTGGSIRVLGENRSLSLANGAWTDNLAGEDLYDCFGDGWLGDGITYRSPVDAVPEALELSYTYDDSPRCVRVYEITP